MARHRDPPNQRPDAARAVLARDLAFGRIHRTRRWLIVGAAGMTAGLAALASALLPGKSLGAKRSATATSRPSGSSATRSSATPQLPAPADPAQLGLQGPSAGPTPSQPTPQSQPAPQQSQPTPAPAPSGGGGAVVSGGS